MLTSDLLRVRRKGDLLLPRYLDRATRQRMLPIVEALIGILGSSLGTRREDLDGLLDAVPYPPKDRLVVLGLKKLLLDRADFAVKDEVDPEAIRDDLFRRAAKHRRELGARETFDRERLVAETAEALGLGAEEVAKSLFSDLRANEQLQSFATIDADALLDRYDVALAQGVLLRATKVQIALDEEEPGRVRQLFRAARFHGLLHRVGRRADDAWLVELDGPLSLFSAVQKYGLKLALFLPSVLRCHRYRLRAEVLWGKRKERLWLEIGPEHGLRPRDERVTGVSPELRDFVARFASLDCAWSVAPNDEIIALPGEAACVPDLVFENQETGEQVFLEAFGFWSRQAVWQRIETLRDHDFPSRIILAVGKQLRVSEELLDDREAADLYVYKTKMNPRRVLERLDAGA